MKNWFDSNILPLYREVIEGKSSSDLTEDINSTKIRKYVVLDTIKDIELYRLQKVYEISSGTEENKSEHRNILLKRYKACSNCTEIEPSNLLEKLQLQRYLIATNEKRKLLELKDSAFIQNLLDVIKTQFTIKNHNITQEIWLKFQYTPIGDLNKILSYLKEPNLDQIAAITCQIIRALCYIENLEIAHCELTTKNILIYPPGIIKISNFANSVDFSQIEVDDLPTDGPIFYTAPEKLRKKILKDENNDAFYNIEYDEKIDIWSIGIILLELFLKCPPLFRAITLKSDLLNKYILFLADLASPNRNKGSGLHHLFYPHYELVKEQIEQNIKQDIDLLKQKLPKINNSNEDLLIILMGFKNQNKRYEQPNNYEIPVFDHVYRLSAYFDFVRKCLIIPPEQRPSAKELSQHRFICKQYEEITDLEENNLIYCMEEQYLKREGRKTLKEDYKINLTISQIIEYIKPLQKHKDFVL